LQSLRDARLRDPNAQDLQSRDPLLERFRQLLDQVLIELLEFLNINLHQSVLAAKLIDFVVDLIKNSDLVVLACIVSHCVEDEIPL